MLEYYITLHYIKFFYSGLSNKKKLLGPLWRHKSETNYIIMSGYDCRNNMRLKFFFRNTGSDGADDVVRETVPEPRTSGSKNSLR